MKKTMLLASAAMVGVGFLAAHAKAQGVPQTVEITKVDVQKVAAGYRASKVIGSSVLNEANETIGKIDDLLVTRDGKEPYAVLSIGGFLGMGTHMVVVRYDSLKFADNKIVLPGGSKDGLKMLPRCTVGRSGDPSRTRTDPATLPIGRSRTRVDLPGDEQPPIAPAQQDIGIVGDTR
jgi:hypothetical protein